MWIAARRSAPPGATLIEEAQGSQGIFERLPPSVVSARPSNVGRLVVLAVRPRSGKGRRRRVFDPHEIPEQTDAIRELELPIVVEVAGVAAVDELSGNKQETQDRVDIRDRDGIVLVRIAAHEVNGLGRQGESDQADEEKTGHPAQHGSHGSPPESHREEIHSKRGAAGLWRRPAAWPRPARSRGGAFARPPDRGSRRRLERGGGASTTARPRAGRNLLCARGMTRCKIRLTGEGGVRAGDLHEPPRNRMGQRKEILPSSAS